MKNLAKLFRRRHRPSVAPEDPPQYEPQLFDSDVAAEIRKLQTFTDLDIKKTGEIICTPYFGLFAGRVVLFQTVGARTRVSVDGAVITTRLDFSRVKGSVEDRCILFLHCEHQRDTEYKIPPPQPHSLQFLCKRSILLNGALPPGIPMKLVSTMNLGNTAKQTLYINIWPTHREAGIVERMKVRVPVHLTFGELASFVKIKAGLPASASNIQFRECDGIHQLQSSRPLQMKHVELNGFLQTPPDILTSPTTGRHMIPVALIGSGSIRAVDATPWMTITELESSIMNLFSIKDTSYIYIPSLFQLEQCRLRMYANAATTTRLLDIKRRNFPIVADDLPYTNYRHLPIYQLTLSETGLLDEFPPLICFEVTGPTVPLIFRAWDFGGDGSGNFSSVRINPRIISINAQWTVATLLKYIDCISRFPASRLINKGSTVPLDVKIKKLFAREWLMNDPAGRRTLSPSMLRVE